MVASYHGHSRMVRVMASVGAEVNVADKYRGTPLHLAAFNGHKETVLTLLALKAEPQFKNQKGQFAWQVATNDDIANILRSFRPANGRTLMHFACEHGSLALVEWIIAGRFGNAVTAWYSSLAAQSATISFSLMQHSTPTPHKGSQSSGAVAHCR